MLNFSAWQRSDVISLLALCVAVGSFFVAWRVHRHNITSKFPEFWADAYALADHKNWWQIQLNIRNYSRDDIFCDSVRVIFPMNARILPGREAYDWKVSFNPEPLTTFPVEKARRVIKYEGAAGPAGDKFEMIRGMPIEQDRHRGDLLMITQPSPVLTALDRAFVHSLICLTWSRNSPTARKSMKLLRIKLPLPTISEDKTM